MNVCISVCPCLSVHVSACGYNGEEVGGRGIDWCIHSCESALVMGWKG